MSKALLARTARDMSAYASIKQGLSEALAFAEDKEAGARIHKVEVPALDAAAIRASTGLSQSAFARSIGVAKGTLLNWEYDRRRPTGPAQVLLAMLAKKPSLGNCCASHWRRK